MPVRTQRVAAYAVVVRDGHVLLSRLAPRVSRHELWTLPGGGLDHGEDPRDAVVREVSEETGLDVTIGPTARTFSLHLPDTWRKGRRVDAHSLRIVYDGWVPKDAPDPRVQEVDGSTVEAAWKPVADVLDGTVPTVALVKEALTTYRPHPQQRRGRLRAGAPRRPGAAHPDLAARLPQRLLDAARRRGRPRRAPARHRGPRAARGVRPGRRGGRRRHRARRAPARHRPRGSRRGLPRRPSRVRRHRARRRRAGRRRDRRHHRRRGLGERGRDRGRGATRSPTWCAPPSRPPAERPRAATGPLLGRALRLGGLGVAGELAVVEPADLLGDLVGRQRDDARLLRQLAGRRPAGTARTPRPRGGPGSGWWR